ncbi:hypothetical protein BC828DRAFT_215206 [Blastocladiella britannica]|nr:hypothetical protein BC828DRAFT_215206 [Blastocladiella britannica]
MSAISVVSGIDGTTIPSRSSGGTGLVRSCSSSMSRSSTSDRMRFSALSRCSCTLMDSYFTTSASLSRSRVCSFWPSSMNFLRYFFSVDTLGPVPVIFQCAGLNNLVQTIGEREVSVLLRVRGSRWGGRGTARGGGCRASCFALCPCTISRQYGQAIMK